MNNNNFEKLGNTSLCTTRSRFHQLDFGNFYHGLKIFISVTVIMFFAAISFINFLKYNNRVTGTSNLQNYKINTSKGEITLEEANNNVFVPLGYRIIEPSLPVPKLEFLKEPTCQTTFSEWIRTFSQPKPIDQMKSIPLDSSLLNGYIDLVNKLPSETPESNGNGGVSIYNAMKNFNFQNLKGLVVGSVTPWVEMNALVNGAKHVVTVEHNKVDVLREFHDRMEHIQPIDFAKNWTKYAGKFDFAITFSSFVYSGTGRNSDSIDPNGDLREIAKIKCTLKRGGFLFLGLHLGPDALVLNSHRVYGPLRLAMIMTGFEWIATYTENQLEPYEINSTTLHQPLFSLIRNTLVLRKL